MRFRCSLLVLIADVLKLKCLDSKLRSAMRPADRQMAAWYALLKITDNFNLTSSSVKSLHWAVKCGRSMASVFIWSSDSEFVNPIFWVGKTSQTLVISQISGILKMQRFDLKLLNLVIRISCWYFSRSRRLGNLEKETRLPIEEKSKIFRFLDWSLSDLEISS